MPYRLEERLCLLVVDDIAVHVDTDLVTHVVSRRILLARCLAVCFRIGVSMTSKGLGTHVSRAAGTFALAGTELVTYCGVDSMCLFAEASRNIVKILGAFLLLMWYNMSRRTA